MNYAEKKYERILNHKQEIVVAVGDTDFNGQVKPSAVMGYCQDIAAEHATMLGLGYKDLIAEGLAWVMIRMSLKIFKSPKIGESLVIKTFPEKPKKLDVNRGYYIYNTAGELVISASSKWCVIDTRTHKIGRLDQLFAKYTDSDYIPNEPFDDANRKIGALPDSGAVIPAPFIVQVTDLDQNFHMNNARYGDMVLNACGVQTLKENRIARVDLNFMSQLFIGDKYEIYKARTGNITFIEARKSGANDVIFRARAEWQKR